MHFKFFDDKTNKIEKKKIISNCVFTHEELQRRDMDIEVPHGVTGIDSGVFWGKKNIRSVHLPETVIKIGNQAFEYCTNLQSINIPNGVTVIPHRAFMSCHSLSSLELPSGLKAIEPYAFAYCQSLKHLDIPSSVFDIEYTAFPDMQITLHYNDVDCTLNMESSQDMEHNNYVEADLLKWFFEVPSEATFEQLKKPLYKVPIALAYLKKGKFYGEYLKKAFVSTATYLIDHDDMEGLIKLLDNKLMHYRHINGALNYAIKKEKHEAYILLAQYKAQLGKYQSDCDRFEL